MNKVFVITGGSRGLGRSLAREVYRNGHSVALLARGKRDLESAQGEISKLKINDQQKLTIHVVDLTQVDDTKKIFKEIFKVHGSIHVLINNAGTWTGGKPVTELTLDNIQESLDLNFYSAFNPTTSLLNLCNKKYGDLAIINVGATASLQGWQEVSAFCIAKAALRSYSQSLARELGPKGVHVAHLIIDGMIDNDRTREINPKVPSENFISAKSIAETILHVVSQERSCWTQEWDTRPYNEEW